MISLDNENIFNQARSILEREDIPDYNGDTYLYINLIKLSIYYSESEMNGESIVQPLKSEPTKYSVLEYLKELEKKYTQFLLKNDPFDYDYEFFKYLPHKYDKYGSEIIYYKLIKEINLGYVLLNDNNVDYIYGKYLPMMSYLYLQDPDFIIENRESSILLLLSIFYDKNNNGIKYIKHHKCFEVFKYINPYSDFKPYDLNLFIEIMNKESYVFFTDIYNALIEDPHSYFSDCDGFKNSLDRFLFKHKFYTLENFDRENIKKLKYS